LILLLLEKQACLEVSISMLPVNKESFSPNLYKFKGSETSNPAC
jgi:hypothetical protein